MSEVFVDTSALYALLVADDANHPRARRAFDSLAAREAALTSTSYVLVETYALLGRRVGLEAVSAFRNDVAPLLEIEWVGPALHDDGLDLLIERGVGGLSLVDAVSFRVMRDRRLTDAFAYDRDFVAEGFSLVDGGPDR